MEKIKKDECLTMRQKNANNKEWYKEHIDSLDGYRSDGMYNDTIVRRKNISINYNLFNNIIDEEDMKLVLKPFGIDDAKLPVSFTNKDIVSGKIKAILGMESKLPFTWKAVSTNAEATSRKEQAQMDMIRQYVTSEIMLPIEQQLEQEVQEKIKGRELSEDEKNQINQEMQEKLKQMTPEEVKIYMERKYQEPAEVLCNQILEYITKKVRFKDKMNEALKHELLSAFGCVYIGTFNGEPEMWVVNPIHIHFNATPDTKFIEDSEALSCEYRMTPSEAVRYFGSDLTEKQINDIYQMKGMGHEQLIERWLEKDTGTFAFNPQDSSYLRVLHSVWKSCRKVGFLTYIDEQGQPQQTVVGEEYVPDFENSDISLEWEWIPEVYEGWKINQDIYVRMRPLPGQFKDMDNLRNCKLPYYGVIHDNMNSTPTSIMDRLKVYQYLYTTIMYRLEHLLSGDKGKKLLMNIDAIPDKIKTRQWEEIFNNTSFAWFSSTNEGYSDANTQAKVLDMSLISDIDKYINLAETVRIQAGRCIGVTDQMEGEIAERAAVQNTNQAIALNSNILEPIFDLHRQFKANVLMGLIEECKVAWFQQSNIKRSYVLDDLSIKMLSVDVGLFDSTTYGIFLADDYKNVEHKQSVDQLALSALQSQQVELSDVISILKINDLTQASEMLKVAEERRREFEQQKQDQQNKFVAEEEEKKRQFEREKFEFDKQLIILKEEERRKTELAKNAVLGASFNPEIDTDNNNKNDFLELTDAFLNQELVRDKLNIEKLKLDHERQVDNEKLDIEREKLKLEEYKAKKAITKNK